MSKRDAEHQAKREDAERQERLQRENAEREYALELKKLEISAKTSTGDIVSQTEVVSAPKVDWHN